MVSKKLEFLRRKAVFALFLVAALALVLGSTAPQLRANQAGAIEYDDVEFFIEVNATDGDAGVQLFLDGEQWRSLMMFNPDGVKLLDVNTEQNLMVQGITEYFFESAEPSFDDVPLDVFLARFPEGEYTFVGETVDGERIEGSAEFTHLIPDAPVIISPREGEVVEADDVEIEWKPVTTPAGVEIESYEVIVESDDADGEFRVLLPGDATEVEVPEAIFDPEVSEYKFEILAKEESGNQTITETEFEVVFEDEDDEDSDDDMDDDDEDADDEDEDSDEDEDDDDKEDRKNDNRRDNGRRTSGSTFSGVVTSMNGTSLRLNRGLGFIIDDGTDIDAGVQVGAEVDVEFIISRGRFIALSVMLESESDEGATEDSDDADEDTLDEYEVDEDGEIEIVGILASMSDSQLVLENGITIVTNSDTDFEDRVRVGDKIEVDAIRDGDKLVAVAVARD